MASKILATPPQNDKPDSIPIPQLMKLLDEIESNSQRAMMRAVAGERLNEALRCLGTLHGIGELRRRLHFVGIGNADKVVRLEL